MSRFLSSYLAIALFGSLSLSPVWGDSGVAAPSSSAGVAAIPKKALGFVCGAAVGTPVSLVRRIIHEDKEGIRGMVGDTDNKFYRVSAGSFWLPFSLLLGGC